MKKLMKKKNNKGFSLVELIVVVLILGILAVALAPQVMKWVGTARENSNENQAKTYQSTIQGALAEWQKDHSIPADNATYTITDTGITNDPTGWTGLKALIDQYTGEDYKKPQGKTSFVVTITGGTNGGKVTVNVNPATP